MALPAPLQSVVDFLRAGYPEGVPDQDYLPLFALLRRQLSDDEVAQVTAVLVDSDQGTGRAAIETAIRNHTPVEPADADVARVRARLAAAGWPLAPSSQLG